MKVFKNIAGIIVILLGGIWMLQGANILAGSAMSGNREWLAIGAILIVFGLGLLYENNRPRISTH